MSVDGPELLALALSLEAEGIDDDEVIDALVAGAHSSATALMSAGAYAHALARDRPYDAVNERTLDLLARAAQKAVHTTADVQDEEEESTLVHLIVEVSGQAAVAPSAVALRTAEVEADMEKLRAAANSEEPAVS